MWVMEVANKACQVGVVRPTSWGVEAIRCMFRRNQPWCLLVRSRLWKWACVWWRGERSGRWSRRVSEYMKVKGRVGVGIRTAGGWVAKMGVFVGGSVEGSGGRGGWARSVATSAQWLAWRRAYDGVRVGWRVHFRFGRPVGASWWESTLRTAKKGCVSL